MPTDKTLSLFSVLSDAIRDGHWLVAGAVAVYLFVALVRWLGSEYVPWLGTKRGGAVLALVAGQVAQLVELLLKGQPLTVASVLSGTVMAFFASGGRTILQNIFKPGTESEKAAAGLMLVLLMIGAGCGHTLASPPAHARQGLRAPEPAPFSVAPEDLDPWCMKWDSCFLACSTATPIFGGLAAVGSGLPALVPELSPRSKGPLLVCAAVAGALAAGTGVCAQACAARYADRCK